MFQYTNAFGKKIPFDIFSFKKSCDYGQRAMHFEMVYVLIDALSIIADITCHIRSTENITALTSMQTDVSHWKSGYCVNITSNSMRQFTMLCLRNQCAIKICAYFIGYSVLQCRIFGIGIDN